MQWAFTSDPSTCSVKRYVQYIDQRWKKTKYSILHIRLKKVIYSKGDYTVVSRLGSKDKNIFTQWLKKSVKCERRTYPFIIRKKGLFWFLWAVEFPGLLTLRNHAPIHFPAISIQPPIVFGMVVAADACVVCNGTYFTSTFCPVAEKKKYRYNYVCIV